MSVMQRHTRWQPCERFSFLCFPNILKYKDTPLLKQDTYYYISIIKGFIKKSECNENERCKRTFGILVVGNPTANIIKY